MNNGRQFPSQVTVSTVEPLQSVCGQHGTFFGQDLSIFESAFLFICFVVVVGGGEAGVDTQRQQQPGWIASSFLAVVVHQQAARLY